MVVGVKWYDGDLVVLPGDAFLLFMLRNIPAGHADVRLIVTAVAVANLVDRCGLRRERVVVDEVGGEGLLPDVGQEVVVEFCKAEGRVVLDALEFGDGVG